MKSIKDCIVKSDDHRRLSKSEKGKTFVLEPAIGCNCEIVAIDDCVFAGEVLRRCDFLFLVTRSNHPDGLENIRRAFFVELKGEDIRSACEQLFNAIDRTRTQVLNYETDALVIGKQGFQPLMASNKYIRKVKKMIGKDIRFEKVHKGNKFTHTEIV